jgi:hypothetical protein
VQIQRVHVKALRCCPDSSVVAVGICHTRGALLLLMMMMMMLQVELLLDMLPDMFEQLLAEAGHIPDTRTLQPSRPLPG